MRSGIDRREVRRARPCRCRTRSEWLALPPLVVSDRGEGSSGDPCAWPARVGPLGWVTERDQVLATAGGGIPEQLACEVRLVDRGGTAPDPKGPGRGQARLPPPTQGEGDR